MRSSWKKNLKSKTNTTNGNALRVWKRDLVIGSWNRGSSFELYNGKQFRTLSIESNRYNGLYRGEFSRTKVPAVFQGKKSKKRLTAKT